MFLKNRLHFRNFQNSFSENKSIRDKHLMQMYFRDLTTFH